MDVMPMLFAPAAFLPEEGAVVEGVWSDGSGLLGRLSELSPWLLAAGWLLLVVRALLQQGRYRAVDVLDEAACARVHEAIRQAEARTVGEVVPVVVERSDPHPAAHTLAALMSLLIGTALLLPVLPFDRPGWLLACQLGLGLVGFAASAWLPGMQRLFIREARADAVVNEQAFQEFYGLGLHRTQAATGVLLFVSLLERRVVVLGDEGIDARLGPQQWSAVTDRVLEGVAAGDLAGGLVAAIELAGDALEEHFPWEDGDRNEVPDRLIVRRD